MSVFEGGGGLLMGHSDPAEASIHSPQHDSAPWGEGPSILYKFIVKNPLICTAGVVKPTNTKKNVNPVIIKIEFARFCGASVGKII